MSIKKVIGLEVETNAEQVGNQFDNLNKSLDETAKTTNKLHEKFEDAYKGAEPLTTVLGEMEDKLYQMALAGKQSTEEFSELLTEVGKYKKTQIDTDLIVDAAAQTMSQKLGGALQGATSGFAIAQGAMGLFGTESETVEKTILKVQSAMAIADGVSQLREGAKSFKMLGLAAKNAFKGMKVGLAATGIGLFVVALGTVVAYWDDIANAIGLANDELEESKALQDKLHNDAVERFKATERSIADIVGIQGSFIKEMHKELELMELRGATDEEIAEKRILAMEAEVDMLKQIDKKRYEDYIEASKNTKIGSQEYENALAKMRTASGNLFDAEHKLEVQRQKDHNAELDRLKELEEQRKADRDRRRARFLQNRDAELSFQRELQDLQLSQLEKTTENEIKILKVKYDRIIEDTKNNEKLKEKQKTALIIEQEKIRDNEINKIRLKSTENLLKLETKSIEDIKPITELKLQEQKEYYDKVDEIAAKSGLKRKEVEEELKNASFNIAKDTLSLVSEINSLFVAKNEKEAKRSFKIDKAAKLASAGIAGVQAVLESFKSASASPITIGFPAYPFIQAGLAGTFAAANIAKISKSKFEGGGGGEVDAAIDSASGGGGGGGATPTAQFNVVGDSGINQLAELQNQQPTKAFVVSGDVTTAQSLDRNRVQNATL